MLTTLIKTTLTCCVLLAVIGCKGRGSNWRIHQEKQITTMPMSNDDAPDWVKGSIPQSENRIYFVGRSLNPDSPRIPLGNTYLRKNGEWFNEHAYLYGFPPQEDGEYYRTPSQRTGFTVMDEREAVQSARNDVSDQMRQRLAPKNMGNASSLTVNNIDSGTCTNCGDKLAVYRTNVQVCNTQCSHNQEPCKSVTNNGVKCGDCHQSVADCSTCSSSVHVTEVILNPNYVSPDLPSLARDITIRNINYDSMMPAIAAYLNEEEVYFEKWHVHEGADSGVRPYAEGRDEWQSYKCWMLCSISTEEFYKIAETFREQYQDLYLASTIRAEEDRERRISDEDNIRQTILTRQDEERDWEKEIQLLKLKYNTDINQSRLGLRVRRFNVEN